MRAFGKLTVFYGDLRCLEQKLINLISEPLIVNGIYVLLEGKGSGSGKYFRAFFLLLV